MTGEDFCALQHARDMRGGLLLQSCVTLSICISTSGYHVLRVTITNCRNTRDIAICDIALAFKLGKRCQQHTGCSSRTHEGGE